MGSSTVVVKDTWAMRRGVVTCHGRGDHTRTRASPQHTRTNHPRTDSHEPGITMKGKGLQMASDICIYVYMHVCICLWCLCMGRGTHTCGAWPRGSRKRRRSSSACGRRCARTSGNPCGSWCGAYQSCSYPWSVGMGHHHVRQSPATPSSGHPSHSRRAGPTPTTHHLSLYHPVNL
jgi:hypothetical protein